MYIYTSLKYCCRILANVCGCRRRDKRLTLFVLRTTAVALVLFVQSSVTRASVRHEGVMACIPSLCCPSPCCPSPGRPSPSSPSPCCPSSGTAPRTACRASSCCDRCSGPARVRCGGVGWVWWWGGEGWHGEGGGGGVGWVRRGVMEWGGCGVGWRGVARRGLAKVPTPVISL